MILQAVESPSKSGRFTVEDREGSSLGCAADERTVGYAGIRDDAGDERGCVALPDGVLVMAIEPGQQSSLDDILGPAERVIDSLDTR